MPAGDISIKIPAPNNAVKIVLCTLWAEPNQNPDPRPIAAKTFLRPGMGPWANIRYDIEHAEQKKKKLVKGKKYFVTVTALNDDGKVLAQTVAHRKKKAV